MYPLDHVSPSSLNSLFMCGHKFQRQKYYGEVELPDLGRTVGSTMHDLQEFGLNHIINNYGSFPALEDYQKMAVHFFESNIREKGLRLKQSDTAKGTVAAAKKVSGFEKIYEYKAVLDAKLAVLEYAKLHFKEILPNLNPIDTNHIELSFLLEIPNMKYKLKGFIDVVEDGKIRDLKCLSNTPKSISISDQYVAYSLWYRTVHGKFPVFIQDTLVKNKKPLYKPLEHTFCEEDIQILLEKMRRFEDAVEKESFSPSTYFGWWCGDGCGFSSDCQYVYRGAGEEKIIKPVKF